MPLLLFLIPIVMFYAWRLWLRQHGQTWKPQARWDSWTADSQRYMDSMQTPRQKLWSKVFIYVAFTALVVYLIFRLAR